MNGQDSGVFDLFKPEYDSEANTLKYDIIAENATTASINLPGEFGQSTLVIGVDRDQSALMKEAGYSGR